MKIGVFGGSFNPVHNGHVALAKAVRRLAALDEVWFVVSPHNPLKSAGGLMPDSLRLKMVAAALDGEDGLKACDYEFRMPRPSYMVNTLAGMARDFPDDEFTLIVGADNWLCFDKWHEYRYILDNFRVAVYPRQGYAVDAGALPPGVEYFDTGLFNVSSTMVRGLMRDGKPIGGLVPQPVAEYLGKYMGQSSEKPLVSVIVPVYNKAEYVEDCLRSVMTQDFDSFEVIAVEDGSTDGSAEICDRLAREYPNLTAVHKDNGGVTAARRMGYEMSSGRYVTFADADDKMLPGALRRLCSEMEATGADEVVARFVNQRGELKGCDGGRYADPSAMIKALLASKADFPVLWGVMFRRELLEGCLDTPRLIRSGEDILAQIECLLKSPKVWLSNEAVYLYNEGLPNDRPLSIDEQSLYDSILYRVFSSRLDEYRPYIVLRQVKMYENFIYKRQFGVCRGYYAFLRSADKSRLSLADRLAVLLPPCLAYYPVAWKKSGL